MMSVKEFQAVGATKVTESQKETSSHNVILASTSLTHTPTMSNASSMFPFITETYRDLHGYISGLREDFQLMQTINKYKKGCNEVYTKAWESYNTCYQLTQNIARTMDIFKELSTCLPDLEEYNYRLCEIMSIFIACELRLSADAAQQEQISIAQRIIFMMRRHLVQEEEHETTSYNILRALVYIPKLFNARDIMCAIFDEFIPLKPVSEVNVLPDKLYMLYIIVFYRWMMMRKDDDDKLLIINFAESFMKPAVSLCSNNLYGAYLPMYTKHSAATRTILNNLKYYGDIRNACIIDNAFKHIGTVVNLCEDEEDDIIFVDVPSTADFAEIFASIRLEPLNSGMSNIRLEEKITVGTVDLTAEEVPLSSEISISELHDKWLNDFQKLANQYREFQFLLEKQQNKQNISNGEKDEIICLESDSEEEPEEVSAAGDKEAAAKEVHKANNLEDLFADNYPATSTPLNCDADLESLEADDENDTTKISPRFLSSNLRTYQPKKSNLLISNDQNKSDCHEPNKSQEIGKAYRRDSIHISSTPPEGQQDEEDEGTDVQNENDDLFEGENETQAYTFLPTTSKRTEKELLGKQIQPMGPYPSYDSVHNDTVVFSQSVSRYSQHLQQQKQHYHSDNSEIKTPKKKKKRVQFNASLLGPTASIEPQKIPLKSALQQTKYTESGAIEYYHLRGFEHFSSFKNLKINLKRIKLTKDISLTNFKNNLTANEEPHATIHNLSRDNFNDTNNYSCTKTDAFPLKTCRAISTINNIEDDKIFKKPLPVTKKFSQVAKKIFTPPKPFKIQKVVSLRKSPYSLKPRGLLKAEDTKKLNNFNLSLQTNDDKCKKVNLLNEKQFRKNETKVNLETYTENNVFDTDVDNLTKMSKLLTEQINSLTCETIKSKDTIKTNNVPYNKEEQNKNPKPILRDLTNESANEAKKLDKMSEKDNEKQSEPINPNVEEITKFALLDDRTLTKKSELSLSHTGNLKPDHLNVNFDTSSHMLKSSELSNCEQSISCSKTEGLTVLKSDGETKNSTDMGSNTEYKEKSPSIEVGENKNITDKTISSRENNISKLTGNGIEIKNMRNTSSTQSNKTDDTSIECSQNLSQLVANFSAEFLAGLPNEPSSSSIDAEQSDFGSKNEIDFEFDNNSSTPTMCDLDVMSENTSDLPVIMSSTMCISECEADKLLEDFNNKTEDIVGCTLSKKTSDTGISFSGNSNDFNNTIENKNVSTSAIIGSKDFLSNREKELCNNLACGNLKRLRDNDDSSTEQECKVNKNDKKANLEKSLLSSDGCLSDEYKSPPMLNEKSNIFIGADESRKAQKASNISSKEEHQETNIINSNKFSDTFKENSGEAINTRNDENDIDGNVQENSEKQDQCSKNDVKFQEKEIASLNEDKHMTVKLGNWDQDKQNKDNTNGSDVSGVSAVFSFPKIPIISISIHTTPNNKTYFKISNRENDNQKKDGGISKKLKSPNSDDKAERLEEDDAVLNNENENHMTDLSQMKKLHSPQTYVEEETGTCALEDNEIKNMEISMQHQAEEYNDEDNEDVEKSEMGEVYDKDIDNFEMEKYSHDSNSACSLPLKKRPTQAEPNDDTNDSQTSSNINYDQTQDIAAEVVIEHISKDKNLSNDTTLIQLQEENSEADKQEGEVNNDGVQRSNYASDLNFLNDIEDNKPSTSSVCFKNLADPSSPFKRRVQTPIRFNGQTPIQIVAPQLKDSFVTPNQENRIMDSVVSSVSRMPTQCIQPLPESYPATPMLSVANVEKLMDFNRFIEDLLASPDVMTIIDNANACGYYAEGQTYELERIAILEHYNIANAKGSTTVAKPLYWKKSAGDTISIFNDNDNEWISLPPSTAKQLQKLSFVLSILQQQYKVTDVRQRINIALAFLIRNTSKFKNTSTSNPLEQRMHLYSRDISNHNNCQLPSLSFFRTATNNESLNQTYNMNSTVENVQNFHPSNNQPQSELIMQQDSAGVNNQNLNTAMQVAITTQVNDQTISVNSPQRFNFKNIESEQPQNQQQTQTPDKRSSSCDELSTDQLYINPPCASSPQNEVIVNTNGVELLEIPEDPENIFISITDESDHANAESSIYKYNTRQQVRPSEDLEAASLSSFHSQQSYCKRSYLSNNGTSIIPNNFMRHNIPTFGNQEIILQNPYRLQQQQQQQNTNININTNFAQRNLPQHNSSINVYNSRQSSPSSQHQKSNQHDPSRFTSTFNTQLSINAQQNPSKIDDPNFKEILQPYITHLIKDHEKTSKHLLQVFEEVSNSNTTSCPVINNSNQHQHQFNSLLPPLIRNPQQNHMPGFHQMTGNCGSVLPSLLRNPHQQPTLITRDSGALQVVQSFIEQSQNCFDAAQQKTDRLLQQQMKPSTVITPGFAKEYVNFVGVREKLRNNNEKHEETNQPHPPEAQLNGPFVHMQQQSDHLNSVKRKCQERNDNLAEDLKRKMVEFSLLKHNVQVKLLEKQQKQQQDHLEAAALFFRQTYPRTISPSLSSASTRSLTSPAPTSTTRKKTRVTKMKTPSTTSIIQNREALNTGYHSTGVPGTSNFGESSDDYYGVASDSDIVTNERYRNDAKLRKRCAVVIKPTKEILQYERKQHQIYNEILLKQRRKLEQRTIEKQKEKERRRVGRREENRDQMELIKESAVVVNDKSFGTSRRTRSNEEPFMSSESEYETTFQVRTRRRKRQISRDLEPISSHLETTAVSTATLLDQIDAHLDKPDYAKSHPFEMEANQEVKQKVNSAGNQKTCEKFQTKMRELNLLADIAQQLSPYQLDSPKNNPPNSPSITKALPHSANSNELSKGRVVVTEQLFIQSTDNLSENRNPCLDKDFSQKQALSNYAHEPILKSSPCSNFLQNEDQRTDPQSENHNHRKKQALTPQTGETLEQILEKSISVLAATCSYNTVNEQQALQNDPATPILISNVESLNQHVQNDIAKQTNEYNVKNCIKSDSENLVLTERKEKKYNTKYIIENDNAVKNSTTDLSSHIINNIESPITCATDLENIPDGTIAVATLNDISLESKISKHLLEMVDPSPVVTDISDNSKESNVSENVEHQFTNINDRTKSTAKNNEISLSDLSLVMPNIIQSSSTTQKNANESNNNQFNSSLNTPIKISAEMSRETEFAKGSTSDFNTPLKFSMQPEVEPEADNNVTTFLDIILNKTVTDAESETRDKIIKELNALSADAVLAPKANEVTFSNNEITESQSDLNNEQNKSIDIEKPVDTNNCAQKTFDKGIDLKKPFVYSTDISKSDKMSEYNSNTCKENTFLCMSKSELRNHTEEHQPHKKNASNDLNPPKRNLPEDHEEICGNKIVELSGTFPLNSLSPLTKSLKQTFNIKCRVRLKRLNMDDLPTIAKVMPTIFITNPVEVQNSNNELTKCNSVKEKTPPMKKTCLKTNNKELEKPTENIFEIPAASEVTPTKKAKLDYEKSIPTNVIQTTISQNLDQHAITQIPQASDTTTKPKPKTLKTVTFDLSNLNEDFRDNTISNHKQKFKCHASIGCSVKNSRTSRKLPDNTLRAAETLQLFVNSINARTRSPPPPEFNKKRSHIKNKCIAEDETPRPPPASSLMGTPPCKKSCTEKSRSHLTSKCKDQLVSSITNSSIPSITSDTTTARIYTASPLDQTLRIYDDNVDPLPTTTGSLRRKLKRPKKSLSRAEPTDDVCTDDIVNQPDCNREDDTNAVVDNEDDDFAEELLPIPAANEHILEEIVSATHIGTSTAIRDEYMNIEATATVPVYLFNDESRDLGSPEVIQSSDYTNVVDSSSYSNTTPTTIQNNVVATPANTISPMGNLEKSMLSPSEHEVSSTQETFYQTPTKNKQTEIFGEKSSTSKEKGNSSSGLTANIILKQKSEDNNLKKKEDYQNASTIGLLQNNQVDTTNHSPEMCNLAITATTTSTPALTNNRKIRKASTHDEILFNELQEQLMSSKRKSNNAKFCVESTSGSINNPNKTKVIDNNLDDTKSNGSLAKVDDKFKKLLKDVCKIDKNQSGVSAVNLGLASVNNNSGGGSSPSTTTTINEECLPRSKRKKLKSSKSKKSKHRTERTSKISLKPSKLTEHITEHIPVKPLIITIQKSRLLKPPTYQPTPINDQQQSEIFNTPNAKLFIEKNRKSQVTPTSALSAYQYTNKMSLMNKELISTTPIMTTQTNCSQNPGDTLAELEKLKSIRIVEPNMQQDIQKINRAPITPKESSGSSSPIMKKREKLKTNNDGSISNKTCINSNNNLIFVKDKYDLIKSKDKYHHNQNQDHQDRDKSKEKTNNHSKSLNSNNSRLHKGPTKEKVKGERSKEKHKLSEKSFVNQSQSASLVSPAQLFSNNIKQSTFKGSKNKSPSSSNATLLFSTTLKSKGKSSTTHLSAATTATSTSQTATATLSTNNK